MPFRCDKGWWLLPGRFHDQVFTPSARSSPNLFMGDSGSYIDTALTGGIPADRSYFYGYTIRWLAVCPSSFIPLLLIQAIAGGATAIVFAMICRRFFNLSRPLSYFFGLLCALDPCELVWERYVMTETFSLLVYVLVLVLAPLPAGSPDLATRVLQALSVVLIGFRMSYLPVVQVCTVLLPVIAFARCALLGLRNRSDSQVSGLGFLTAGGAQLLASVAMMFVMHRPYKHVNGWLTKREPAYLYATGFHLASMWAPALEPSDATDPRFRDLIAKGYEFKLNDLRRRNEQHFSKGFLMDRWEKIEKNWRERERIAKETAMNALRRRPLQIIGLAVKTYLQYWHIQAIQRDRTK